MWANPGRQQKTAESKISSGDSRTESRTGIQNHQQPAEHGATPRILKLLGRVTLRRGVGWRLRSFYLETKKKVGEIFIKI